MISFKPALVSVIIPVYNTEQFLAQCLNSLLAQTYRELEIIVVIDGATDRSAEIAASYIEKDQRVRVIYQENAGSGSARNNGLRHASGEYVMFVDSDDWVDPDIVERLCECASSYDMVISGTMEERVSKHGRHYTRAMQTSDKNYRGADALHAAYLRLFRENFMCAPAAKLYRLSVIRDHQLQFPVLRRSQDIVFNYRFFDCIQNLQVLSYTGYHYRISESNYILRIHPGYYKTASQIISDLRELHEAWHVPLSESKLYNACLYLYTICFESSIVSGEPIQPLLEIPQLRRAYAAATNKRPDIVLLKFGVKHRRPKLIQRVIKLRILCRPLFRSHTASALISSAERGTR